MHYDNYSVTMLISAILNVCVGGLVLIKKPHNETARTWCFFSLCLSVYLLGKFFAYTSLTQANALKYVSIFELGLLFIPAAFLHFVFTFTKEEVQNSLIKAAVVLAYSISLTLFVIDRTTLVSQVAVRYLSGYTIYAPNMQVFSFLFYLVSFGVGLVVFIIAYKRVSGLREPQYLLIAIAFSGGFILSITDFLKVFNWPIPSLGPMAIVFINSVVAYAIVKHQFLEIKIIIRRALIYTCMTLGLTFIYLSVIFMAGEFIGSIDQNQRLAVTITFIFFVAILFEPLRGFVQAFIDRLFFKDIYDRQMAMSEFSNHIVKTLDVDELLDRTLEIMSKTFRISSTFIMLLDQDHDSFALRAFLGWERDELMERYPAVDSFTGILNSNTIIRARGASKYTADTEYAKRTLHRLGADVAVALQTKNRLTGFICMKEELPGNLTDHDVEAVRALADQLSIAIENVDLSERTDQGRQHIFDKKYFNKRLKAELSRSQRLKLPVTILYISLNDEAASRKAIKEASKCIKAKIRSFDVAGRLSQNVFGLILPGANQAEAEQLMSRLDSELKAVGKFDYDVIERYN